MLIISLYCEILWAELSSPWFHQNEGFQYGKVNIYIKRIFGKVSTVCGILDFSLCVRIIPLVGMVGFLP